MLETTQRDISLTREELYEQVWTTPMSRLARQYGMTDVGLAKICRKHKIPRPPRGYWAKLRNGQSPRKARLPHPDDDTTINLNEYPEGEVQDFDEVARHKHVEFEVQVRDNLRGAHALVSQTNEALGAARVNEHGLIVPPEKLPLAVKVSKASLRRALLIIDALLKAFEKRGYRVIAGPKVELDGIQVGFSVEELLETKSEQSEEHDLSGSYTFGHSRFDKKWVPSGRLQLRLEGGGEYWARGSRHSWSDGQKSMLEQRLKKVLPAMLAYVELKKEHEAELKRRADEQRAEELRREREAKLRAEKRKEYRAELVRFRQLTRQVKSWRLSHELRVFIETATQDHIQKHGSVESGSKFAEWLEWASCQADRLDPLCESRPSILDEDPKTFEDPKPGYLGSWYRQ
jgi:hypothetical protein